MKTVYEQYMSRQTVSADLHSKLLALEQCHQKAGKKSTGRVVQMRWKSAAALAASLVLVVGLGIWVNQAGLFQMGRSSSPVAEAAVEEAVEPTEYGDVAEPTADYSAEEPAMENLAPAEGEYDTKSDSIVAQHMIEQQENDAALSDTEPTGDNADFLLDSFVVFDADAAEDASRLLEKAGCGLLIAMEVAQENEDARSLVLTDEAGKTFTVTVDGQGAISSIRDEDGTEWYAVTE